MIEKSVFWPQKKNYWLYRKKFNVNFVDIKKIYQTQFIDLNLVNNNYLFMKKRIKVN